MIEKFKELSLLNKIFNVHAGEWPKIFIAWAIRFFYTVSFVIAWTVIVAMFVAKYGISYLPHLFVINAVFTFFGSLIYSSFLDKFDSGRIITFTIFLLGIVLFSAAFFFRANSVLFFLLLLIAESIFLIQLKLLLFSFIEKMFNPLESERTFPLIEASDTVAGIIGGLLIVLLSGSIETYKFVYIWVGAVFLIIPFLFVYDSFSNNLNFFKCDDVADVGSDSGSRSVSGFVTTIKKEFADSRHFSFIKGLFFIVFFQWLLFNLLEFQYMSAVYANISEFVFVAGAGFEHAFVHDLGALFMFFSLFALCFQLIAGSRIISSLGVIGSMLVHPIVTFFSVLGLIFSFNFGTAVFAKNNFNLSSILYNSAYHSTYYGVKEKLRDHTREFLEGFVRPIGAIVGTMALLVLQRFFEGGSLTFSVNVLLSIAAVFMFYSIYSQQHKYTDLALSDLVQTNDKILRFNAIDILSQRGHASSLPFMLDILSDENESISIRVRILRALSELQSYDAFESIIKCLSSSKSAIREAAVDSLLAYGNLIKPSGNLVYLRLQLFEALKKAYKIEKYDRIRIKFISLLSNLSNVAALEFLLDILNDLRGDLKSEIIYTLGNYKDPDLLKFVKPYLNSDDQSYQMNAAIAFGRLKSKRYLALALIDQFLDSADDSKIALAIFAIGELQLKKYRKLCFSFLSSSNLDLKISAALCLAKMGYPESVPVLLDLLFSSDHVTSAEVLSLLRGVDLRVYKNIHRIIKHLVYFEIEKLLNESKFASINELEKTDLKKLRWLYCLAGEYDEMENIDNILAF